MTVLQHQMVEFWQQELAEKRQAFRHVGHILQASQLIFKWIQLAKN